MNFELSKKKVISSLVFPTILGIIISGFIFLQSSTIYGDIKNPSYELRIVLIYFCIIFIVSSLIIYLVLSLLEKGPYKEKRVIKELKVNKETNKKETFWRTRRLEIIIFILLCVLWIIIITILSLIFNNSKCMVASINPPGTPLPENFKFCWNLENSIKLLGGFDLPIFPIILFLILSIIFAKIYRKLITI